ncbi:hypothetical protein [Streptomyces sp. NPDC059256]|uniref:hypothetical protein n=1 Tax=Streptomyces sp. NPDC059256 TaxID=3346794 RepID=UPI0036A81BB5
MAWLLDYIPAAIGYADHPDYAIYLLEEEFPVTVSTLIATATVEFNKTDSPHCAAPQPLPFREPAQRKTRPRLTEAWTAFPWPTQAAHDHTG